MTRQAMHRLVPANNRMRINTLNHIVKPDCAIAELVLMYHEGDEDTSVRMKATHANSLWSAPCVRPGSMVC